MTEVPKAAHTSGLTALCCFLDVWQKGHVAPAIATEARNLFPLGLPVLVAGALPRHELADGRTGARGGLFVRLNL